MTTKHNKKGVPRHVLDLNLPPHERWRAIMMKYDQPIKKVDAHATALLKMIAPQPWLQFLLQCLLTIIAFGVSFLSPYGAEMCAMAKMANIRLYKFVAMQYLYEACACCTSIVVHDANTGLPLHIRTMDWNLNLLKPLTIELEVKRGGRTLFIATTWAGCVGVFTGMRVNQGYSISLNYRRTKKGTFLNNVWQACIGGSSAAVLIRQTLESQPDFNHAVQTLAKTRLVAPCYFTIAGCAPCEGVVITRNANTTENQWTMGHQSHVVQTNMDHWAKGDDTDENIMLSVDRCQLVNDTLSSGKSTPEQLWTLLSKWPVCNEVTIYGTLMIPAQNILETRLPSTKGFE